MIFIVEWARTADGGRVRLVGGRVGVAWVRLDFGLVILESERCILVTN